MISVTLIFAKRDFYSPKYIGDYSSINTPPEIEDGTPKMDPSKKNSEPWLETLIFSIGKLCRSLLDPLADVNLANNFGQTELHQQFPAGNVAKSVNNVVPNYIKYPPANYNNISHLENRNIIFKNFGW